LYAIDARGGEEGGGDYARLFPVKGGGGTLVCLLSEGRKVHDFSSDPIYLISSLVYVCCDFALRQDVHEKKLNLVSILKE